MVLDTFLYANSSKNARINAIVQSCWNYIRGLANSAMCCHYTYGQCEVSKMRKYFSYA